MSKIILNTLGILVLIILITIAYQHETLTGREELTLSFANEDDIRFLKSKELCYDGVVYIRAHKMFGAKYNATTKQIETCTKTEINNG